MCLVDQIASILALNIHLFYPTNTRIPRIPRMPIRLYARFMKGSCLCGSVTYEVDQFAAPIVHCHCQKCRKAHGSAFSTTGPALREHFRWLTGEELLSHFESSPGKRRHFCSKCGSHLIAEWPEKPAVIIRMGCLDDDPGKKPKAHIWRSEGACWYDPTDELPQLAEGRPS